MHGLNGEDAADQISEKSYFRFGATARLKQVDDLANNEVWNEQRPRMGRKQLKATQVVLVVSVDVGV